MTHHLVVLRQQYLDLLLKGRKSIECRLSTYRRPPFETVRRGDLLWFKLPCGPIRAVAAAGNCLYRRFSGDDGCEHLLQQHARAIAAEPGFFDGAGRWARFASLIWIEQIVAIGPLEVRKSDRRAWVVLPGPPRPGELIADGAATELVPDFNPATNRKKPAVFQRPSTNRRAR